MKSSQTKQSENTKNKKIRVYELAKQYGVSSKEFVEELHGYGIPIKNHMSTLDPETVQLIETERNAAKPPPTEPPEAKVEPPSTSTKKKTKKSKKVAAVSTIDEAKVVEAKTEPPKEDATISEEKTVPTVPQIQEGVTVGLLASEIGFKGTEMIMRLMKLGIMASINQRLDYETLQAISDQFGFEAVRKLTLEEQILQDEPDDAANLLARSPVITIMGHVDHGKTSLLDAIRQSNVMDTEAGQITQHIGAYHVELESGSVVFLDTPGHAAFTAMRARGAQVTDIVVLVVAADDGVMPQTVEALNHAKAAGVPILVALNKMDVENARPDYVKQQLAEYDLVPEEWGGQTIFVEISAKERIGIEELLEMLLLEAELLELSANPNKPARGTVAEAKLDKGRGPVATVLVQSGTLQVGDAFVAGRYYGKVRAMINDRGQRVKNAPPSTPVEVLGFTGVPEAGDQFFAVDSERDARALSESRQEQHRATQLGPQSRVSLDDLFDQIREGDIKELNIIVKGDVQGSVEAVFDSLQRLSTDEVKINVIHQAVGGITETDVLLASASNAIVVGFNVHPTTGALIAKENEDIDVRTYSVIYDLISDVQSAMEGLLEPEVREVVVGRGIVRELFRTPRMGTIAGSYVNWGRIIRNYALRVLRDNRLIYEGQVDSLRHFKDDVTEVQANYECGIGVSAFDDFKVDDVLECYTHERIPRSLR
ncbi:translation initiation factor IF-2 [Candidatus Poribacteria bacterium]|nr:MAG: translation initiation factor IF-2 [Candidatus Poribacteria bacterium]